MYTTFFVCKPQELAEGFPGWRLPLPQPVRREFKNPFTGKVSTIETREPEWQDEGDQAFDRDYQAVAIEGSYEDYLERRLPPFVHTLPHWAAKSLTEVELSPLAQAVGVAPRFECPLYGPPASGAVLQELSPDMLSKLALLDERGVDAAAEKWAATMSTPEYTRSMTGSNIKDGWTASEAMEILRPIVALARQAGAGQRMYLLIEA